jgi:NAD(P) transhydrogenase
MVSDDVLQLKTIPSSMIVIGAGVIGVEYATMFAALGVRVTIVDKRQTLLPFLDHGFPLRSLTSPSKIG